MVTSSGRSREELVMLSELRKYLRLLEYDPRTEETYSQGLSGLVTRVKAAVEEILGSPAESVAGILEKTAKEWHNPPRGWSGCLPEIGHNYQTAAHDLIGISKGRRCPRTFGEYAPEYRSCFAA